MVDRDFVPSWDRLQCNPCISPPWVKSPLPNPCVKKPPTPPYPLPRFLPPPPFWHFSVWPKFLILGEALTQNFKKTLHTNLRKQTWGARREESLVLAGGVEGSFPPRDKAAGLDGPHPGEPRVPGSLAHPGRALSALAGRRGRGVILPPSRVWGRPRHPGVGVGGARPGAPAAARPARPCARQPVRASAPRRWRPERRRGTSGSRRAPGACLAADPRPRHTDVNRSARPAPRGPRPPPPSGSARASRRVGAVGGVGARRAGAGAQRPPSLPTSCRLSTLRLRRLPPHPHPTPSPGLR